MSKQSIQDQIAEEIARINAAEKSTQPPGASIIPRYNRLDNDLDALPR